MVSGRHYHILTQKVLLVLILVLVEDGLGALERDLGIEYMGTVLILVLVEDGLGGYECI